MIVSCTKTGFTVGNKLYNEGELFLLSNQLIEVFGKLNDAQLTKKQKKMYGAVFFRRLSPDELKNYFDDPEGTKKVFGGRQLTMDILDPKEKKILGDYAVSKHHRMLQAAKVLQGEANIEIEPDEEEESAVDEPVAEEKVEEPVVEDAPSEEPEPEPETEKEESTEESEKAEEESAPASEEAPPEQPASEKKSTKGSSKSKKQ